MTEIVRPDLVDADPGEVAQHLLDRSWTTGVRYWREEDGLHIDARGVSENTLTAALADFVPTAESGHWEPPLPGALREHAGHLRTFRDAVRAGDPPTLAQTQHVLADVIDWIRLSDERL